MWFSLPPSHSFSLSRSLTRTPDDCPFPRRFSPSTCEICLQSPLPRCPTSSLSQREGSTMASKHHDRLFMLTTGLWITPLRNEDKYALAFISRRPLPPPLHPRVFFLPFLPARPPLHPFFFSLSLPLPCVFLLLLSVNMCTCATQIAVDGFNRMAAPLFLSCVSLPVYGSLPFGVLRRARLRKKQKGASTLCQKCRDEKGKKKKKKSGSPSPPHKGGF